MSYSCDIINEQIAWRGETHDIDRNSDQAVPFYQNVFDAKLVCSHSNDDGTIAHAELDIFGQILAISESDQKETITGNSMQFCLHFGEGNEELVRRIIDNLSDGGEILYPGPVEWSPLLTDLIDKFGVRWCIFV